MALFFFFYLPAKKKATSNPKLPRLNFLFPVFSASASALLLVCNYKSRGKNSHPNESVGTGGSIDEWPSHCKKRVSEEEKPTIKSELTNNKTESPSL